MKWEYKTYESSYPDPEFELNELSEKGWELVSTTFSHSDRFVRYFFYFKRPIKKDILQCKTNLTFI